MPIDRSALLERNNIKLDYIDCDAPLTIGNGDFAFTADVTGLQTLYDDYKTSFPLCTMHTFGWHTEPDQGRTYTLDDLEMTEYARGGRRFCYPVQKTDENQKVYDWLRQNPHRFNLFRLGYECQEKEIKKEQISEIAQELRLNDGILRSSFRLQGQECHTETAVGGEKSTLAVRVHSGLLKEGKLNLCLSFSYGASDITGADWDSPEKHSTSVCRTGENSWLIRREMDGQRYAIKLVLKNGLLPETDVVGTPGGQDGHCVRIAAVDGNLPLEAAFTVSLQGNGAVNIPSHLEADERGTDSAEAGKIIQAVYRSSEKMWKGFWERIGLVDFSGVEDIRARELERREVLSLYLLRLQSAGSMPPAETGLSCNSWYGKAHLEMHFWHSAFLPLYGAEKQLEKSFAWYLAHLKEARENAARNGYGGARWPKMVAFDAQDSPSPIAPLLIWQQSHIIFMLELAYRTTDQKEALLKAYGELVHETAAFMAEFAEWNEEKRCYELMPPLIPVQETHKPMESRNPVFELEYWKEGLEIACEWEERLGRGKAPKWREIAENMALPAEQDGVYLAHELAADTYTKHAKDHPSMLMAYGVLKGELIRKDVMERTLGKVKETWDFNTAWGWDFAVMAMTATRLGKPEMAVELLLMDTQKNQYAVNGNNRQGYRRDLPLYLPGNGSFLYALAVMAAGYTGNTRQHPGFPESWKLEVEGISPAI